MPIDELKWRTMTGTVNRMLSPNQFLKRLLFPNEQTVGTDLIEFSVISKGREVAPFVKKNGEATMVGGYNESFNVVSPTNIRIKRPFAPNELLFGRRAGTPIFIDSGQQLSAVQQHINRDLQVMADLITNAEEYLVAQALTGVISYTNSDREAFEITFPRAGSNTITLSIFWDAADPTTVRLEAHVYQVKKLASDLGMPAITDAICGDEAVGALQKLIATGNIKVLDLRSVSAGTATFVEQFSADGVLYLGELYGIRWWAYTRTALVNGVSVPMIRPKYVEFVSNNAASERTMYYGAIADMTAFLGGSIQSKRFSKSWLVEDPSAMFALTHTRPLPVPRKPDATISMKVISG
jgi:hypothetical protein